MAREWEHFIAAVLDAYGVPYAREVHFGTRRADFVLVGLDIVIEVDDAGHNTHATHRRDKEMDDVYRQAGFTPIHVLEYDLDNRPDETISALLRTVGERLRDCGVWRPVKDDQDVLNADLIAQMARIKKRRERTGVLAAPKAKYQYTCVSCGRRIYTHCEKCARNVKYRCSHCRK